MTVRPHDFHEYISSIAERAEVRAGTRCLWKHRSGREGLIFSYSARNANGVRLGLFDRTPR